MNLDFWQQVALSALTTIVSAGLVGGFFWQLLQKGIEQKLAVILEKHKADLAAQIHAHNTVFSRLDKQRADAVQKIDAEIKSYNWEFIDFKPRSILNNINDKSPPSEQAFRWCLEMQVQAKNVLVSCLNSSILLPDDLGIKVAVVWYQLANWFPVELIRVFGLVADSEEYRNADDNKKRELLFEAKTKFAPDIQQKMNEINSDITKYLRKMLTEVEREKH